jgi:phosphohistidine phosphatase
MKRLTLMRHAKSTWDQPSLRDFERPLNERGRHAALLVGKHLRRSGARFDLVLASPATRVVQTLEHLSHGYAAHLEPQFERLIYDGGKDDLLSLVRATDASVSHLLLVGHNPTLHELALALLESSRAGGQNQLSGKFPTASLADIELPAADWKDAREGTGRLLSFVRPRDLVT